MKWICIAPTAVRPLVNIYGKTLEYMTDALESTPAGVYGGGCSLDDCLRTEYANREPFPLTEILGSLYY